jgi:hypothetical protein
MVPRLLALLLLLAAPAAADRAAWVEARDTLAKAYFDQLPADRRDPLFTAFGSWDHPEVLASFAEVASRFGTYLDALAAEAADYQGKLDVYKRRRALSEDDIALRDHYTKKLEKVEATWRQARASEDVLVKVLGSYRDARTIQSALSVLASHASSEVRLLLARACAHWHAALADTKMSAKLFASLKKLQKDPDLGVRVGVARALGAFRHAEALELLGVCAKDGDWRVRAAVVRSVAQTRSPESVTLLIDMMGREEGRLKDDINAVLKAFTGQDHGFADSWAKWWKDSGRQLPREAGEPAGQTDAERRAAELARFYGIPTRSQRICFIIDVSGSMTAEVEQLKPKVVVTGSKETDIPVEGKTRMEVAKNELKRAVSNLSPDKLFNVIFFNQAVRTWRPAMEKATPDVREALRKDVDIVAASGTTYTLGALREAFLIAGVKAAGGEPDPKAGVGIDTIFLLSDGGPTDNKMENSQPMDPEIILESVRQWNRDAGIVIHTIAVDTEPVGTYFLKQLAAQNGGQFVERRK